MATVRHVGQTRNNNNSSSKGSRQRKCEQTLLRAGRYVFSEKRSRRSRFEICPHIGAYLPIDATTLSFSFEIFRSREAVCMLYLLRSVELQHLPVVYGVVECACREFNTKT